MATTSRTSAVTVNVHGSSGAMPYNNREHVERALQEVSSFGRHISPFD